jgi:hypothetical protein
MSKHYKIEFGRGESEKVECERIKINTNGDLSLLTGEHCTTVARAYTAGHWTRIELIMERASEE